MAKIAKTRKADFVKMVKNLVSGAGEDAEQGDVPGMKEEDRDSERQEAQ